MPTVLQDVRFALRQLIKIPGFTLTAIVSLMLGIGATTAVFSVVWAILMDPYPYERGVELRGPRKLNHVVHYKEVGRERKRFVA